jgi:hypothetical protein
MQRDHLRLSRLGYQCGHRYLLVADEIVPVPCFRMRVSLAWIGKGGHDSTDGGIEQMPAHIRRGRVANYPHEASSGTDKCSGT